MTPQAEHTELVVIEAVDDIMAFGAVHAQPVSPRGKPSDYPETIETPLASALLKHSPETVFAKFQNQLVDYFWPPDDDSQNLVGVFIVWYDVIEEMPSVDIFAMRPLSWDCCKHLADCAIRLTQVVKREETQTWQ